MKMNKFVCAAAFITFASVAFAAPPAKLIELSNKLMSSTATCATSSGLSEKEAKEFYETKTTVPKNVGCFVSCMGKELDLVNDKNLFDKEKIFKLVDMIQAEGPMPMPKDEYEKNKEITLACLDAQKADPDPCVIGKNIAQCMIDSAIKAGYKF